MRDRDGMIGQRIEGDGKCARQKVCNKKRRYPCATPNNIYNTYIAGYIHMTQGVSLCVCVCAHLHANCIYAQKINY